MNHNNIIRRTEKFVQESLKDLESGHNWFHITRVRKNALFIAKKENADVFIVELAALLHDIGDSKFHKGDESVGPKMAQDFLESLKVKKKLLNILSRL